MGTNANADVSGSAIRVAVLMATCTIMALLAVRLLPRLEPGLRLAVEYAYVGNIRPGSDVRLGGVRVGAVERVELIKEWTELSTPQDPTVRLHLVIQWRAADMVTEGAQFLVMPTPLIAARYVDVIPGPGSAPRLADGTVVRGMDLPRTDILAARAQTLVDLAERLLTTHEDRLADIVQGRAAVRTMLGVNIQESQLRDVLDATERVLKSSERLMVPAEKVLGGTGASPAVGLQELVHRMDHAGRKMEDTLSRLEAGRGRGRVGLDEEVRREIRALRDELRRAPWKGLARDPPARGTQRQREGQ